jgi:hypothetical protein
MTQAAASHDAATAPRTISGPLRAALALGTTGALGEELLAALVASPDYRVVHVAMKKMIASSTPKYRAWQVGSSLIDADDAYLCVTGPETLAPRGSPLVIFDAAHVLEGARLAQEAGVRRLVLVAPLSALLQMNATSHALSSESELVLLDMRFETLVIVRPTRDDASDEGGAWLGRTVRAFGKMALDIMLPTHVQALRPQTAALAILTAVQRCPPGVHVISARELLDIVAESMPALLPKRPRLR